jgi:flagellar biosynthetic protein FliR
VTLGLLSRAAPSLNVFSLAFPLRVIVALIVVALAVPLISPAVSNLVHDAMAPLGVG